MPETATRVATSRIPSFALAVALVVVVITQIPYWLGERWAPAGTAFDGMLGMSDDQNMYFSFIRQGAEERWLFVNRLTHLDHRPALLNIEWLAVGRLMRMLRGSEAATYAIWRIVGVGTLILGFWSLAAFVLPDRFRRRAALLLCTFGGGFGWIFLVLERGGAIEPNPLATLDLSEAIHPFSHMFANPHLAVSHGLSLFFLAAFAAGEKTHKARWYVVGSAIAVLHGLVRPYDLILIYGILPIFVLIERIVTNSWNWRATALRLLPLAATAPMLGYYVWLFRWHSVFKYWSSQGDVPTVGPGWYFLAFGLAGVLYLARLCLLRHYPLHSSIERLLVVWIAGVLFLVYGKHLPGFGFIPYSPVFLVSLASVMLLVGGAVIEPRLFFPDDRASRGRTVVLAMCLCLASLGSAVWMLKVCHNLRSFPDHYISQAEIGAYAWMNEHGSETDVVLSTLPSGNRMAKYVSARFVLGHRFVTPHAEELSERVTQFYGGQMTAAEAAALLDEFQVRRIYLGPNEQRLGDADLGAIRGMTPAFSRPGVRVFEYAPGRVE